MSEGYGFESSAFPGEYCPKTVLPREHQNRCTELGPVFRQFMRMSYFNVGHVHGTGPEKEGRLNN